MKKVSLIYVAQGSYWETRHSFESIGFAIKEKEKEFVIKDEPKEYIKTIGETEIQLFVIDFTNDTRTTSYFEAIATEVITCKEPRVISEVEYAKLCNQAFRKCTEDFVCLLHTGVYFHNSLWLVELIYYYLNVNNSGVVGVPYQVGRMNYQPLPNKENEQLIGVFVPKDNVVKGVAFFDRQLLYMVGGFDEQAPLFTHELEQFCLRCIYSGYSNYYIPSDSCVYLSEGKFVDPYNDIIGVNNMNVSLDEMRKRKSYYIPL